MNVFENIDCMEGMKRYPDNHFDYAVVDPPYFDGPNKRVYYGNEISPIGVDRRDYGIIKSWEVPKGDYFKELERISKNQIVWGVNYFDYNFGPGRIIWDKCNYKSSFSDCEIAYCSSHDSVRLFRYMWSGMMQGKSIEEGHIMQGNKKLNEKRIHPTQKPINLYRWLCMKYLKKGMKVIDTHVGSGSSLIAYEEFGIQYVGYELDQEQYKKTSERLNDYKSQIQLIDLSMV